MVIALPVLAVGASLMQIKGTKKKHIQTWTRTTKRRNIQN